MILKQTENRQRLRFLANVDILCLLALEVGTRDERHQRVQLVRAVLVLVAPTAQPNAYAEGNVAHALRPHLLVQTGVDAYVRSAHLLLGKFADLFNGARSTLLESDTVQPFV